MDLKENSAMSKLLTLHIGCIIFTQVIAGLSALCTVPLIPHGKVISRSGVPVAAGERRRIDCESGYKISGSSFITCKPDGSWSATYSGPKCIAIGSQTKCSHPNILNGKALNPNREGERWTEVEVVCNRGFKLSGEHFIVCKDGRWSPVNESADFPKCVRKTCLQLSNIKNAEIKSRGITTTIQCHPGYNIKNSDGSPASEATLRCVGGQWDRRVPTCVILKPCPQPPQIPFANVQYYKARPVDGSKVTYYCQNGYTMDNQDLAELTCVDGEWLGTLPTCTITIRCGSPQYIPNGNWTREGGDVTYEVNTKIRYRCKKGFRLLGESLIWCKEDQSWSHNPPRCIPLTDETAYCTSPPDLPHGQCTCEGHDQSYCEPFTPGMRWLCHCGPGYALEGAVALICTPRGHWNHDMPDCVPVNEINTNSDLTTPDSSHISTLAIVVATACSVLGVLLLVMVAVIFRRHKPRPRLYHTTPAPPPYTRVHSNSVDEHDRVALIAYAEGRQIALPSYDEATRGGQRTASATNYSTSAAIVNEGVAHGQQYRPLPPVPAVLRGTHQQTNPQHPNPTDNNNRHSTATTTSTVHNRDGFPEVFGSLDTVNVSISDASTAGTMETVDSGASNPSLASRRANAGSLGSSNGSLANDDAPLLESSHDGRIMSTSSEPLPEEDKEE